MHKVQIRSKRTILYKIRVIVMCTDSGVGLLPCAKQLMANSGVYSDKAALSLYTPEFAISC